MFLCRVFLEPGVIQEHLEDLGGDSGNSDLLWKLEDFHPQTQSHHSHCRMKEQNTNLDKRLQKKEPNTKFIARNLFMIELKP